MRRSKVIWSLRLREGTIVDATIIEAPSSTKNRAGARDPEMRQTEPISLWNESAYRGGCGSLATTPANVHDVTEAQLHGGESQVWGDAGSWESRKGGRIGSWRWIGKWL